MIYPTNIEHKIDFQVIRDGLKGFCTSSLGKERVDQMHWLTDYAAIQSLLSYLREMLTLLSDVSITFPQGEIYDLREALSRIRIEGLFMDESELFSLRKMLDYAALLNRFFSTLDKITYPLLSAQNAVNNQLLIVNSIDRILDRYGKMRDNASPELARIRKEIHHSQGTVSRALNTILRQAQAEGILDKDAAPTLREGRLVLPVPPAYKRKIGGIVHDESATGKTVFIEPQQVVEANNRIRELEGEERRERMRILLEITEQIRPNIPDILEVESYLADVDFLRAKALFSIDIQALVPEVYDRSLVDWREAFHPVLWLKFRRLGKMVIPLSIRLIDNRILLISGPNAGGKSVCLKTVALLQYMMQCGMLPTLYENSHVGIFDSIFIDIGDDQSIEDDLSTYSSHLRNMKYFLQHGNKRTLTLIDEFGGGTEPIIGGAIAQAILKDFNSKGMWGVITTHYQNLKNFAEDTPGLINGSMLYDRHLMQPLFKLHIGNPGSSFAIEIARKTGLPVSIINDAEEIAGSDYVKMDRYLLDIARDKRYWESKRKSVHQKEKELDEILGKVQEQGDELKKSRKQILKEAREEAERLLREANAKIENTIRTIVEAKAEKERTRQARQELTDFGKQLEELARQKQQMQTDREMAKILARQERKKNGKQQKGGAAPAAGENKPQQPERKHPKIEVGMYVRIEGQQAIGEVMTLKHNAAIVRFGAIKSTVSLERLRPSEAPKEEVRKVSFLSSETQEQLHNKRLNFKEDMDIRGMRGEEAVQAVGYFLDDAVVCNVHRLRILHGTGNGILRTLVRQYLSTMPFVKHFHDEHVQFGGAGITVVELE